MFVCFLMSIFVYILDNLHETLCRMRYLQFLLALYLLTHCQLSVVYCWRKLLNVTILRQHPLKVWVTPILCSCLNELWLRKRKRNWVKRKERKQANMSPVTRDGWDTCPRCTSFSSWLGEDCWSDLWLWKKSIICRLIQECNAYIISYHQYISECGLWKGKTL